MNFDVRINLPEGAKLIIDTIQAAGYEAYAVGGCVRDRHGSFLLPARRQ